MRFRKTLTFLMLAMGLVFALSAWAQQKPFDARPSAEPWCGTDSETSRARS